MTNLFPIEKQAAFPLFGRFTHAYRNEFFSRWPLLESFDIDIFTVDEYLGLPNEILRKVMIDDIREQSFASFIYKKEVAIETTNAGIIYNESLIRQLGLTESEQFAAIAHEIGHILYFFLENKRDYPELQGEEIYADKLACEIGLAAEMLSTIEKLERSGISRDPINQFRMRKCMIINVFLK